MPTFAEYKGIARARGALAFEVFVVTSRPVGDPEAMFEHLKEHVAYMTANETAGNLVMSGPLSDEAGIEMSGIGFQVWRADSWEAAKAFADADPMHVAGVKAYELRRWLINEGNLSMSIGLSSGSVALS